MRNRAVPSNHRGWHCNLLAVEGESNSWFVLPPTAGLALPVRLISVRKPRNAGVHGRLRPEEPVQEPDTQGD